jgi:hypothetical protein
LRVLGSTNFTHTSMSCPGINFYSENRKIKNKKQEGEWRDLSNKKTKPKTNRETFSTV